MIAGVPFRPDAGYSTHAPVLAALIAKTGGGVAEVGAGFFSTPLLEAMVRAPRELATFETDPSWFYSMLPERRPGRTVRFRLEGEIPDLRRFEVALVDSSPSSFRADIAVWCGAKIVVLHDANPDWEGDYGYRARVLPKFRYHGFYARLYPWTLVVSDEVDPVELLPGLLFRES